MTEMSCAEMQKEFDQELDELEARLIQNFKENRTYMADTVAVEIEHKQTEFEEEKFDKNERR